MKGHSWFSTDSSFVTALETLISTNLKHEKQQVCFCFQFFCSLGQVETIILIIQKRPSIHIEDAVTTRSLAALCSSSLDLHLINSASHRELNLQRITYLVEPCNFRSRLSAMGNLLVATCEPQPRQPALHPPLGELACLRLCLQEWRNSLLPPLRFWYQMRVQRQFFSVRKGHWIPFLSSLFSKAALSFDTHPSAQRNFYISMFNVLLAESHGQKKISTPVKTET